MRDLTPTEAEKRFISRLGKHSMVGATLGKEEMLVHYWQALTKRERWDGMDPLEILNHLKEERVHAKLAGEEKPVPFLDVM